jgi:trimeric autotransporter adhesin
MFVFRSPSRIALFASLLLAVHGCGSSETSITAPSAGSRCVVSLDIRNPEVPASGGSGTLTVATSRECTWTASVEGSWLSITGGRAGQGEGAVEFTASPNPDPVVRRGAVVLNDARAEIVQAAAPCDVSIAGDRAEFGQSGGVGHIDVRASSASCSWTALSDDPWIVLSARQGQGSTRLRYDVQPSSGAPRTGLITVGGQRFSVVQADGCTYDVHPPSHSVTAAGGVATVQIATAAACPWTAVSDVPWIAVAGPTTGSGPATMTLTVDATPGPARTGSALVAGHRVSVSQQAADPAPGPGPAPPAPPPPPPAPPAPSPPPAPPPPAPPAPAPECTYTIDPQSATIGAAGGTGRVTVSAGDDCSWTASSRVPWVSVIAGENGRGRGTVEYRAAASTGSSRTGTIEIAGRTFTLTQDQGCTYALSSSSLDMDAAGGPASFSVQAPAGCAWTATSAVAWITVTGGANGTGSGPVRLQIDPNAGAARTGVVTAAGQAFTVRQAGACVYDVSPTSHRLPGSGGAAAIEVSTGEQCAWTATSEAAWLSVTSGADGRGSSTVRIAAEPNDGAERSGTLTVAGRTITVIQEARAAECQATVTPGTVDMDARGGPIQLRVAVAASCAWTSESAVPWIRVTAGTQGTGNGPVLLQVERNTGAPREGQVTVAGTRVRVIQGGAD